MERVDQKRREGWQGMQETYGQGLRGTFSACHEPLPTKMEELIHRLSETSDAFEGVD